MHVSHFVFVEIKYLANGEIKGKPNYSSAVYTNLSILI